MSFDLGESIDDWDSKSIGNCSETALVCPVEHAPVIAMATREFHLIAHFFPLVAGSNRKLLGNCSETALCYQWNTISHLEQIPRKWPLSRNPISVPKLHWNGTGTALGLPVEYKILHLAIETKILIPNCHKTALELH